MQLTTKRLRWALLTAGVLMVCAVAATVGYGKWRAFKKYREIAKKIGATVLQDTDNFTYSQTVQGRTVFTVHASKARKKEKGVWSLQNADFVLYGHSPGHDDHVHASEVEYDEREGVARAIGTVYIELEVPVHAGDRKGATPAGPPVADSMHVKTSGLVYLRRLGIAATDQSVEFTYRGMDGSARGAEFNANQSTVRLLADVAINGTLKRAPAHLKAAELDLDRVLNTAVLRKAVLTSGAMTGSADEAHLDLRKDGSLSHAVLTGAVDVQSGTRTVHAMRGEGSFDTESLPQNARLSGGVRFADTAASRPADGHSSELNLRFGPGGQIEQAVASGDASLHDVDKRDAQRPLQHNVSGDKLTASFAAAKGSAVLQRLDADGRAHTAWDSTDADAHGGPRPQQNTLTAQHISALMHARGRGADTIDSVQADKDVHFDQRAAAGEERSTVSDHLTLRFVQGSADQKQRVDRAEETGHVHILSRSAAQAGRAAKDDSTADAEHAEYRADTGLTTLTGHPRLDGNGMQLTAQTVTINQQTRDAEAHGGVQGTSVGSGPQALPVHVQAAEAKLVHATNVAVFRGTDVAPARLWQGSSQVQAAEITVDNAHHNLAARPQARSGRVHATFAAQATPQSTTPTKSAQPGAGFVRVDAPALDYADADRRAVFSGGVELHGAFGDARSATATAVLSESAKTMSSQAGGGVSSTMLSGSLDHIQLDGAVRLSQPGRTALGDHLRYTAATDTSVLTGSPGRPPVVEDVQQGRISGASITFAARGSSIVVAGTETDHPATAGRVRSEVLSAPSNNHDHATKP